MTREEAKQLLPLIQAYINGETVQHKPCGEDRWIDKSDVIFTDIPSAYRIKPKPRECWLATPTALGLNLNPEAKEQICNVPTWNPAYWTFTLMREVKQP